MDHILPSSSWTVDPSKDDASVNHVVATKDGGMLECRFVQRKENYFIIYVSSHTGCNHSCRFCHLTATRQTMMSPASFEDYLSQVKKVLQTYEERKQNGLKPVSKVHVNFMSRGEALSNPTLVEQGVALFNKMEEIIHSVEPEAEVHFLVSSIIPKDFSGDLSVILNHPRAYLYYSLYSLDPSFRKRWLPKAMNPYEALELSKRYQQQTGQRVVLHWAMIEGQNDSEAQVQDIINEVQGLDLKVKFNLVRYNPHDSRHGQETSEKKLQQLFSMLKEAFGDSESRIVPRVGFDVKASCGMFVDPKEEQAQV